MRRNKQMTTQFILLGLLLIGVVYAILQANLQINGTAKIQANTWDIHFDNIVVNENSVSIGENDSDATIDPENNCKVDFEVTLSIPGDFYEFTIDVVNAGTIDGMIGELNKTLKVNNEVVSEVPDYLNYSVTYSDGVEIEDNHKIEAGTTETYLVRLEFKTDIEELPQATTITTSLEPQYLQADTTAVPVLHPSILYNVFRIESLSNSGLVSEYIGNHKDSFTKKGIEKIYHWYATSDDNANIILDKWNVIFGGFCWKMYRTTDTGGVKLIYSGIPNNEKCTASGTGQQISSAYYNNSSSLGYAGYMYNPDTILKTKNENTIESGVLFGRDVSYDFQNNTYSLIDPTSTRDNYHHYSCNNTTGICSVVRYYHYSNYYVELSLGNNITKAIQNMLYADNVNQTNSNIKNVIDNWYANNLLDYASKLEDIVFCNNRTITDYAGWNPNGGRLNDELIFTTNLSDLSCPNITDQFSMNNEKAQLVYPVGLMSATEAKLFNNKLLRSSNNWFWLITPKNYFNLEGQYYVFDDGTISYNYSGISTGVRPVVSLKPGTKYKSGDGSKNNPYIVE